jgi:hypothetical protein
LIQLANDGESASKWRISTSDEFQIDTSIQLFCLDFRYIYICLFYLNQYDRNNDHYSCYYHFKMSVIIIAIVNIIIDTNTVMIIIIIFYMDIYIYIYNMYIYMYIICTYMDIYIYVCIYIYI